MRLKKPKWWTGSPLVISALIALAGLVIWQAVSAIWPDTTAAKLSARLFGLLGLPFVLLLMLGRVAGIFAGWLKLLGRTLR